MSFKTGIQLIAEEREEHFTKHGRTMADDALQNTNRELTQVAKALLETHPAIMDFPKQWDKAIVARMANKTYRERLIIAGALIAAEIDRLRLTPTAV